MCTLGQHRLGILSASCSTPVCVHLQAPLRCYGLDLGIPLVLRWSAPSVGATMGCRGGLSADDSARPPGATQSPSVPSVPLVSMAEVSCPSPNNALGGGSEWTRPNEGEFLLTGLGPEGQTRTKNHNTTVTWHYKRVSSSCELPDAVAVAASGWVERSLASTRHGRGWFLPVPPSGRAKLPVRAPLRRRSTGLDRRL